MEPVNEDLAHSYLKGMIERERVSFQEQKKHYESSKYFISKDEDEFQSWMAKERKKKRNVDSQGIIASPIVDKTKPSFVSLQARESPAFSDEDGRSCNNRVRSVSKRDAEDNEIMRKISEQRRRGDAMMRRLRSMGQNERVKVTGNWRRAVIVPVESIPILPIREAPTDNWNLRQHMMWD